MHIHFRLHGHRCLKCPQYIQVEVDPPTFFLRQIVASYILQRGVFVLIISSSSRD